MNILKKIFRISNNSNNSKNNEEILSSVITATVPQFGNFKFEIHKRQDQYISADLSKNHIWEPFETDVFCRLCKDGDFVLDIGANIGWYSVIASKLVGKKGRIISFEPDPINSVLLKNNITLASANQVEVKNIALGDSVKPTKLYLSDNNLGDHRLFSDEIKRDSTNIQMNTLDSLFLKENVLPDLVKSDTQGSEGRILKGATHLLSDGWRPIWLIEFWPYGLVNSNQDPKNLWELLKNLGYQMYEVSEAYPKLVELNEKRLIKRLESDISVQSGGFINILAMPADSERSIYIKDLLEI